MQTVLITGGTGLVGKAMSKYLIKEGYRVIILTRKQVKPDEKALITYAHWDVIHGQMDTDIIKKTDYIIHLAGANVMEKKWSASYKKEIVESRTKSSALLVNTLKNNTHNIKAVISASAIGYYGEDLIPGHSFEETDKAEDSFLGNTCKYWEESIDPVKDLSIRLVKFRIGIVLSKEGGALAQFIKPVKFKLVPILGNGKQQISWIEISDICRLFLFAVKNEQLEGTFNAVAPNPVNQKNLMVSLAKHIAGKFWIPFYVPSFFLKLFLGQRSIEILKSATVSSRKITGAGFNFLYPTIDKTIADL